MKTDDKDLNFHVGHRERLRQKFLDGKLADYELLELLLSFVIPRRDVRPLARGLMQKFNTSMDDFEYLLKQRDNNINGSIKDFIVETEKIEPLQANKSASLEDFIVMLSNITDKALKYLDVKFIPDEGARLLKDQKEMIIRNKRIQ